MKKILVIDDDQDILDAVSLLLQTEGYEADVITKGDETYTKIEVFQPDIILLDVLLSGNDGRTICKNLKKDTKTKQIPIIMMSAHPTAKHSAFESGADSFVPKPFSIEELLSSIRAYE